MDVLPAIDLRGGKVVRLTKGDYDRQTTYSDDPAQVAAAFVEAGAGWIHVVDLDAARSGELANLEALRAIRQAVDVCIEFGGGVRTEETLRQLLALGVTRAVIGSAALKDWPWFEGLLAQSDLAGRMALGLDARHGRLALHGWTEQVDTTPVELAERVRGSGLGAIVHTDISRDGMLAGVNIDATAEVVRATDVPVVASGGVRSIEDVRQCREIGCGGVIIGKAYYEGKLDLAEACRLARPDA